MWPWQTRSKTPPPATHLFFRLSTKWRKNSSLTDHEPKTGPLMMDDSTTKAVYKGCLYIPKSAHHDLVTAAPSSFQGGHGGHLHTIALLSKDYWWPGLSTYIWKYVSGCAVCQAHKVLTHPTVPAITPLAFKGSYPFQNLSIDLITDLPPVNSLDSVMVMVNHGLSKGVILTPCTKTVNATEIAQLFFKYVFKWFRLHKKVMSD